MARDEWNNQSGAVLTQVQDQNKGLERKEAEAVKKLNVEMQKLYHSKTVDVYL